jgi:DNA repair exonuclease SbcCD ATPase subunit
MNIQASIGHNQAPDPLDEALAPYGDHISEAENWLDGSPVQDEQQMKAVDALLKQIKAAKRDVTAAQKSESAPLHDAWKASLARFKPTIEDLDRQAKGLAALVDGFKRKLAEEKRAAERAAWEAAEKARKEAAAKAAAADTANIEEQRESDEARRVAQEAEKEAQLARRDAKGIKGLRTVTRHQIESHKVALHWIAANDQDAMTAFIEDYVRLNHKSKQIDGVKVWQEQEAF